jgi:hypothetical protein
MRINCGPRRVLSRRSTRRLFLPAAVAAAALYAEDFAGKVVAITGMRHNGASERSQLWWNDGPRDEAAIRHAPSSSPGIWLSDRR